ncbi:hypothetical protein HPP92_019170 [Vanilla planifolia]|uniref:Bacterial surface antigen (D15) domain-containing protein n=1 Tax=Vanilla planifolia TaxID=51239 RepID=A0A835UP35_VANPL|nr:hypothetical protein HPP92_019170 [Vanilla planifolia]
MVVKSKKGNGLTGATAHFFYSSYKKKDLWSLEGILRNETIWRIYEQVSWKLEMFEEFDLRGALPLGFFHSALNVGVAAGLIMPWGNGFMSSATPLPDRFYMGGSSSPLCSLGGPGSLLGFKMRGLGPIDFRRTIPSKSDGTVDPPATPGWDAVGGDLAVTACADISFNLPLKVLRDSGIYGHAFVSAGNLEKLSEGSIKDFSFKRFLRNFRSSAGVGIIVPTKLFRMEVNYCYILRHLEHDKGKSG